MSISFSRFAGLAAIISLPLSLACLALLLVAIDFNMEAFTTYSLLLGRGEEAATSFRWGMLLDMLGYYLFIVPAVLWARRYFQPQEKGWLDLATISLLGYSLVGAIGAAILATTIPPILSDISGASGAQYVSLETTFHTFSRAVYDGLWNLLEQLAGGMGWLILGFLSLKSHRWLGITTIILGISCLADAFGSMANIEAVASTGQSVYLVLAPLWAAWIGVIIYRAKR